MTVALSQIRAVLRQRVTVKAKLVLDEIPNKVIPITRSIGAKEGGNGVRLDESGRRATDRQ